MSTSTSACQMTSKHSGSSSGGFTMSSSSKSHLRQHNTPNSLSSTHNRPKCDFSSHFSHTEPNCFLKERLMCQLNHPSSSTPPPTSTSFQPFSDTTQFTSSVSSSALSSTFHPEAQSSWNADTGASAHMTFNRHWMRNLKPHHVQIRLADGSVVYSEGVGSVRFNPVVNGQEMAPLEFTDVLYVPALSSTSLSIVASQYPLRGTPCTSSGMARSLFVPRLEPPMPHISLVTPSLWRSMPPFQLLPLSPWTGTSAIVAFAIHTWQASRSCFQATWSQVSSLIHKQTLIQYVKPAKLARCMQIPFQTRPLEPPNHFSLSTVMSMAL
jgi:hypothetical protein